MFFLPSGNCCIAIENGPVIFCSYVGLPEGTLKSAWLLNDVKSINPDRSILGTSEVDSAFPMAHNARGSSVPKPAQVLERLIHLGLR